MPPLPVEGASTHYFTPEAARYCAAEIREAVGVEVFFIGNRGESGLVEEVESHAYGSPGAVPALIKLAKPGDVFIHNHPSGVLMPSDADLSVAAEAGNQGIGCYIINNDCSQCRVVVKPQDAKKKVILKEEEVLDRLRVRGSLAKVVGDFEDRPQQRDMAASIVRAFNHDGISVIEAGTGTGKSFAYLVPSILFALRNNERVVISTATINLQEQLLHKDVPAVLKAIGEPAEVEIVKGRSNYVCKRKASFAGEESVSLIEDEYVRELKEILAWAEGSPTGDRNDLPIQPRYEVWERVQSEADNCLRVRCPFYEQCFFYNSRRRAARAKILIVNHSLLMTDLAVRRASGNYSTAAVLPPYTRVVLDEAHHLEEVATNNLASQVTRAGLRQLLTRFHRRESRGGHAVGILTTLQDEISKLAEKHDIDPTDDTIQKLVMELIPRVGDVRDVLDFLLEDFGRQFLRLLRIADPKPGDEQKIRLKPVLVQDPIWRDECLPLLAAMVSELAKFVDQNRELLKGFEDIDEKVYQALVNGLMEWQALVGRLDALRMTIISFQSDSIDVCRWVEILQPIGQRRDLVVRLCLAPVDVKGLLRESLHDRMKSEVLTSATLTVDRTFDFFQERAGLPLIGRPEDKEQEFDEDGLPIVDRNPVEARPIETHLLSTPFDYRKQVFFAVPSDMPDPREPDFDDRLVDLINRSVAITGGRAFILFTAYGQMNRVYKACEPTIRRLGIDVLRQGTENRDALLRRFREDETSVLFATSSFWEGVDVKGRALELLIIAKLPFAVPTEPVQEAQFEALQAMGRDPFENLVVPRAVIRLKQGFGRLIRSRTDRGAVIVADKRVVQMRYGRRFLYSLPDINLRKGLAHDLMGEMRLFFDPKTEKGLE